MGYILVLRELLVSISCWCAPLCPLLFAAYQKLKLDKVGGMLKMCSKLYC